MRSVQRIISAGGIVLRLGAQHRELLVVRRSRNVERKWRPVLCQLPKGTQLPGESLQATAIREVTEETGHRVEIVGPATMASWRYRRGRQWFVEQVHYFRMHATAAAPIAHDDEFDEVSWVDLVAAPGLLSYPEERALIQEVVNREASPFARSRLAHTKAGRLQAIRNHLRNAVVDDFITVALSGWRTNPKAVLGDIRHHFLKDEPLIVRSSAVEEDEYDGALAGAFRSVCVLHPNETRKLSTALTQVAASFRRNGRADSGDDHIIVQRLVRNVTVSGVVITSDIWNHPAYYLINYDRSPDATNQVTVGRAGRAVRILRGVGMEVLPAMWQGLMVAVREVEQIFPRENLAIEFAVDDSGLVHIFQVRGLALLPAALGRRVATVRQSIRVLQGRLAHLPQAGLVGRHALFSDMADWNPAEMLGPRPAKLDVSLYRILITSGAWNTGRVSLGYTDVCPAELLSVLGDKPYIDLRVSLNSLTPSAVPVGLRRELVEWGITTLARRPELHDKVEFELAFSCFDLGFAARADRITEVVGTRAAQQLRSILTVFTRALLDNGPGILTHDLAALEEMRRSQKINPPNPTEFTPLLAVTKQRLLACRDSTIVMFSRLARLAFVGLGLLRSLRDSGTISAEFYESFLASPRTIADEVRVACRRVASKRLSTSDFFRDYGFLRPMSYNLLSSRYDQMPTDWWLAPSDMPARRTPRAAFNERRELARIDQALKSARLPGDSRRLLAFVRTAIEARELAKYVLTRDISDALEGIATAGQLVGLSRPVLSAIPFEELAAVAHGSKRTEREWGRHWAKISARHAAEQEKWSAVALPPVLGMNADLRVVEYPESTPNFVTRQQVRGRTLSLGVTPPKPLPPLRDRIVLLESADPGFDWIFNHHPMGLVTKYGGAGSHMTIRCAAFGIPAAIGCGEVLFAKLLDAEAVVLDGATGTVVAVH